MKYYTDIFVQWKKYWTTFRGKIFSITTFILVILLLLTYKLSAIFFLVMILIIEYLLYSNPDPKIRFRRNLIFFLLGIFEVGTMSFTASKDIGIIGFVTGLFLGSFVALILHIILTLGTIVGGINAIKYYHASKKLIS